MNFEVFISISAFVVEVLFLIMSLRNKVFENIPLLDRVLFTILCLVPICGTFINIGTFTLFLKEVKSGKRVFRPSMINKYVFGKSRCYE